MATQIRISVFVLVAGIVLAALAVRRTEGARDELRFDAAKLKDRTSWIQVNAEPYQMPAPVAALCAAGPLAGSSQKDPHASAYITVYVNKIGRDAMFAKQAQRFPEGSMIVKEKYSTPEDRTPLLYTIMRKRTAGYNPKVGDWEFSVVGPNGTQVQAIGKLENCQGCHLGKSESDFVFRPYVKLQ